MFYDIRDKLIYVTPSNVKYDPLALYRKLLTSNGGIINDRLQIWTAEDSSEFQKAVAETDLVTIARHCFDLKPFDVEGGVTDGVALNCLVDFVEWLQKNG